MVGGRGEVRGGDAEVKILPDDLRLFFGFFLANPGYCLVKPG